VGRFNDPAKAIIPLSGDLCGLLYRRLNILLHPNPPDSLAGAQSQQKAYPAQAVGGRQSQPKSYDQE